MIKLIKRRNLFLNGKRKINQYLNTLIDLKEKQFRKPNQKEKITLKELKEFKLLLNGKEIICKDFVQEIIANGLLGMVETLDLSNLENKKIDDIKIDIKFF